MVTRRGVLGVLIGVGATAAYLETDMLTGLVSGLDSEVSGLTGPPPTNESIGSAQGDGYFEKLELYESGAAEITLKAGHGCYERIAFGHTANNMPEDAYRIWQAPEFSGPKVVDLKSVVQSNGPYPNRKFEFELLPGKDEVCFSIGQKWMHIRVPESWMPE